MKKSVVLTLLISVLFVFAVSAKYEKIEDTVLGIDPNMVGQISDFNLPDSIVVGVVSAPSVSKNIDFRTWYQGMSYYQITRFGLPSISFHYVISPQGELILNKNSQPERVISVQGLDNQNPILIGYFAENGSIGLSSIQQNNLSEVLLDIANENAIPIENIYIKNIEFEENSQRSLIIKASDLFGTWNNDLQKIKEGLTTKYSPLQKEYKVEVVGEPVLPAGKLKVREEFEVKLKIKNTGEEIIYEGSRGEFFLSLNNESEISKFFINDVWVSQTQAKLMQEGEVLKPGEEKEYVFKGKTPLEFGTITEDFVLVNSGSEEVDDAVIKVELDVDKPEGQIIEILDTETGYLRVRSESNLNSEEVERVSPGERYFVIGTESGFYQIDLGGEKTGWVYSKYVRSIQ